MSNNEIIYQSAMLAGIVTESDLESGDLPELHTFNEWKRAGYVVRKGEHAVLSCYIWMPRTGSKNKAQQAEYIPVDADGDDAATVKSSFYKKLAFFFRAEQVEPLKA